MNAHFTWIGGLSRIHKEREVQRFTKGDEANRAQNMKLTLKYILISWPKKTLAEKLEML